jgi:protein-tyrosine phosphatase
MPTTIKDVPMSEVYENIYIGTMHDAASYRRLKKARITHILNMTSNVPFNFEEKFVCKRIPINDDLETNIAPHLLEMASFIKEAIFEGRVLVHCASGISRSGAAVIAYLVRYHWIHPSTALKLITNKRKDVNPNYNFMDQLKVYHDNFIKNPRALMGSFRSHGSIQKLPQLQNSVRKLPEKIEPKVHNLRFSQMNFTSSNNQLISKASIRKRNCKSFWSELMTEAKSNNNVNCMKISGVYPKLPPIIAKIGSTASFHECFL